MAKIENFNDIDSALKRVCELSVAMEKINGEVTLECNKIKESRKPEIDRLDNEKKFLEQEITLFCEENKAEFAKKRSKEFTFGTIAYRLSKSVSIPRVKAKVEALLKAIKSYGLNEDCIIYEEKPNKDALCELKDEGLVKLGIKRTIKDNFRIDLKIENLQTNL